MNTKTLIIAEKPSVAADIAKALGGFARAGAKGAEYFERDDTIISSGIGHLVEIECPPEHDPGFKLDKLPAIPPQFNLKPVQRTASQLHLLKQLIHRQDVGTVVNACDAGREGELIFRYIVMFCGCRKPMQRMWLQSMTAPAIKEAHAKMQPSQKYDALFQAAQCRSEADWLFGINGTRGITIFMERATGQRDRQTVGRVQTPTLFLTVEREEKIRSFKPTPYYEIHATFAAHKGSFVAKWLNPNFVADPKSPETKAERLFDKSQAEAIIRRCEGRVPASVTDTKEEVVSKPPTLFDLTTLQREANTKFGLSAKQTLDIAQTLYEKHKATTYPRTDANALPEDYPATAQKTLTLLGQAGTPVSGFATQAIPMVNGADKRVFNNSKISDHFAIIPTGQIPTGLSAAEQKVYDLIVRRFVAVFFPAAIYHKTVRTVLLEGETFQTSGRVLVKEGWLVVYGKDVETDKDEPALCPLQPNELPPNSAIEIKSLKTKPPKRFTEATLLAAMENAGKQVEDEDLRAAMSERGLGTPATRAAIIEKLLEDKDSKGNPITPYLVREKKDLAPTDKALQLIAFLRTNQLMMLATPETTGEWEYKLNQMQKTKFTRREFMGEIHQVVRDLIARCQALAKQYPDPRATQEYIGHCPCCQGAMQQDAKTIRCTACEFVLWKTIAGRPLNDGEILQLLTTGKTALLDGFVSAKTHKPFAAMLKIEGTKVNFDFPPRGESLAEKPRQADPAKGETACPQCGKPMRKRQGAKGDFWGCSGYPACKTTMMDSNGKPVPKPVRVD